MDSMVTRLDKLYPKLRNRCHFCGRKATSMHHIKPRHSLLIRYDLKNLLPVCDDCHRLIHDKSLKVENFISPQRWLYLNQMEQIQFQDYLLAHNLTREEFFKLKEKELKEAINGDQKIR